jgi:O-antigen/teichoic acid export membrane protein
MSIGTKNTWVAGFNILMMQLDKLILGTMNPALLAVYQVGSMVPIRIKDKLKELLVVPILHWSNKPKEQYTAKILGFSSIFFAIGFTMTLGLWLSAEPLVRILYGTKYGDAILILKVMSLIFPVHIWGTAVINIDLFKGNTSFYQKSVYVSQVIYLAALLPAISSFGPIGAAAASVFRVYMMNFLFPLILIVKLRREQKVAVGR